MCCLHFGVSWEKIGDHPEPASGSTGSEKMPPAKTHSGESTHEYPQEVCENLYGWRSRAGAPRIPPIWSRSLPRLASAQSSQEATHTEWQAGQVFTRGSLIQQNQTSRLQEGQRFFILFLNQISATKKMQQFCNFFLNEFFVSFAKRKMFLCLTLSHPLHHDTSGCHRDSAPGFLLGTFDGRYPFPIAYYYPSSYLWDVCLHILRAADGCGPSSRKAGTCQEEALTQLED